MKELSILILQIQIDFIIMIDLSYLTISDEKRKGLDFILTNQDSILISNEDLSGKVYVLEFFLQDVQIYVLR